jgi:hypothetical protein
VLALVDTWGIGKSFDILYVIVYHPLCGPLLAILFNDWIRRVGAIGLCGVGEHGGSSLRDNRVSDIKRWLSTCLFNTHSHNKQYG